MSIKTLRSLIRKNSNMKNFVFISPHFPDSFYRFVVALKKNGFRVLGIGDDPYENLRPELKEALTEYYVCYNMDNFGNEVKAVKYFEDKYGHIDYLESNNEYWLDKDAKLREMFGIITGPMGDEIDFYNHKSLMKIGYLKAGAKVAKYILVSDRESLEKFIEEVDYPVFIKPDHGVGAEGTYKIEKPADIDYFFNNCDKQGLYICEQFVSGNILSFDGICNSKSEVVFCASNFFPPSIADMVHEKKDLFYYSYPYPPKDLEEIGRKVIKAFGVKQRFFHLEFFRLTKPAKGLGDVGDIVPLETNMRPAGGYTPDLINFANSNNVYQIYADVMAFDENRQKDEYEHYYAPVASRRDEFSYLHSDEELLNKYKNQICHHGRYAPVFSGAMGDRFFMAKFKTLEEVEEFREFAEARN